MQKYVNNAKQKTEQTEGLKTQDNDKLNKK